MFLQWSQNVYLILFDGTVYLCERFVGTERTCRRLPLGCCLFENSISSQGYLSKPVTKRSGKNSRVA